MFLSDQYIEQLANQGMITPFISKLVKRIEDKGILSFGLSSYGYDVRLSPDDFKIFRHIPGTVVNPKAFNPENLEKAKLHQDEYGQFFILPAHSYGLSVVMECLKMPANITAIVLNKSSLVRCGIVMPATVVEAGWHGYLTLEIYNASDADCRIYANEGIGQLLFFEGEKCSTSYGDRTGKYQNQLAEITLPRI